MGFRGAGVWAKGARLGGLHLGPTLDSLLRWLSRRGGVAATPREAWPGVGCDHMPPDQGSGLCGPAGPRAMGSLHTVVRGPARPSHLLGTAQASGGQRQLPGKARWVSRVVRPGVGRGHRHPVGTGLPLPSASPSTQPPQAVASAVAPTSP